jgi:hypothetical protein
MEKSVELRYILDIYKTLCSQRAVYETEWEELARIYTPGMQSFQSKSKPWEIETRSIDGHAAYFKQKLVSHVFSQSVNPQTKFVKYSVSDKKVVLTKEEEIELDEINSRILQKFASSRSNFSTAIQQCIESGVVFGPGVLYVDNKIGDGIKFKTLPLSQCYVAENDSGLVDTIYRKFKFTAKQLVQSFGITNVSKTVQATHEANPEEEFEVLHCIYPNKESKKLRDKYLAYYVELGNEHVLDKQYLSHFPCVVFRWASMIGEKYGHGQGKLSLTSVRMLSKARQQSILAKELANRPILLTSDDGVLIPNPLNPGMVIEGGMMDGQKRIDILPIQGNIQAGDDIYQRELELLGQIFFAEDIATPIDKTRRTAVEINTMNNDRFRFMTSHIAKLIDQLFKPMADLVLQLMVENGEFNDLKTKVLDLDLEPEFLGPITQLLKMEDVRATQNFMQSVLPMVQLDPSIINRINFDMFVKDTQKGTGTPSYILRSDEEVEAIQAQQQAQQQQQMDMQSALGSSEVAKNLGQANKFNQGI